MALNQTTGTQSSKQTVARQTIKDSKYGSSSIQTRMEELTPLQRERLDAAVMMLVNYLVSASSGS